MAGTTAPTLASATPVRHPAVLAAAAGTGSGPPGPVDAAGAEEDLDFHIYAQPVALYEVLSARRVRGRVRAWIV